MVWQEQPGLLLYAVEQVPGTPLCGDTVQGAVVCAADFLFLDNARAYYRCAGPGKTLCQVWNVGQITANVVGVGEVVKGGVTLEPS